MPTTDEVYEMHRRFLALPQVHQRAVALAIDIKAKEARRNYHKAVLNRQMSYAQALMQADKALVKSASWHWIRCIVHAYSATMPQNILDEHWQEFCLLIQTGEYEETKPTSGDGIP